MPMLLHLNLTTCEVDPFIMGLTIGDEKMI